MAVFFLSSNKRAFSAFLLTMILLLPLIGNAGSSRACRGLFDSPEDRFLSVATQVDGRMVYYRHLPAKRGKPTIFLFTGLLTPEHTFHRFLEEFARESRGEGLIVFFYSTTVDALKMSARLQPDEYTDRLQTTLDDYVRQAEAVLAHTGVDRHLHLVGYSFGSAPMARFVETSKYNIANQIFLNPLVTMGDFVFGLEQSKRAVEMMARMNPLLGSVLIENMRQSTAEQFAKYFIQESALEQATGLSRDVLAKALTYQIRTADDFDLRDANIVAWPKTHFIVGGKESPVRLALLDQVIRRENREAKNPGSVVQIPGAIHRMLQDSPEPAVKTILELVRAKKD